jgi:hypothetical protein
MKPTLVKPGLFRDRREAGRMLAERLAAYANCPDVLMLALPRGGVPVAYARPTAARLPPKFASDADRGFGGAVRDAAN